MTISQKGAHAGIVDIKSVFGDTDIEDFLEAIKLLMKERDLDRHTLKELQLLNERFEEAFKTHINHKDVSDVY